MRKPSSPVIPVLLSVFLLKFLQRCLHYKLQVVFSRSLRRKIQINLHFARSKCNLIGMSKRTPPTHPQARRHIIALGKRLRAARLRRKMTQPMLAERVGVSVPTIGKLEDGDPSTSMATMLRVLTVLGLAEDIDLLAAQDTLGRSLQDSELKRAMPTPQKKIDRPPPIKAPPGDMTARARAALTVPAPPARKKS